MIFSRVSVSSLLVIELSLEVIIIGAPLASKGPEEYLLAQIMSLNITFRSSHVMRVGGS
jgi:hypothetical protein